MLSLNRNSRSYHLLIWIAALFCIIVLISLIERLDAKNNTIDDYPEYWAAGRLLSQGHNPYSVENVVELRNEVGQSLELTEDAAIFLYPPWALPLVLPFSLLPYPFSRVLWLLLNIIFLMLSINRIWHLYAGHSRPRWIVWIIAIAFFPTILVLVMGHINLFFLLIFTLFITLVDRNQKNLMAELFAGLCISLVTIKFHLHYLFLLASCLWILRNKRWAILVFTIGSIFGLTLITLAFDPQVLAQYFHLLKTYPFYTFATPALGSTLRNIFGINQFWLQFIPPVFGIVWLFLFWKKKKKLWRWSEQLPLLLLVSVCTAAFEWTYDYVILLLPIFQCSIWLLRDRDKRAANLFFGLLIFSNLVALFLHSRFISLSDFWLFWFSPAILVWFLMVQKYINRVNMNLRFA